MTVVIEIIFELLKKLYRFFGPALILAVAAVAAFIFVQVKTESNAILDTMHSESNEVLSFEEIRYDEERMDRVFRAVIRNNSADPNTYASLYITDEDGKSIFNDVRNEFEELRICGKHTIISYVPPGSECTVEVHIDDYKLDGLDHIYVRDLYSSRQGKRFDIAVKRYDS